MIYLLTALAFAGDWYGDGAVLHGYDVVTYHQDGPEKGSAEHTSTYEGGTFHFKSAANKKLFDADPKKYAPRYNGYCAYAVGNSAQKVKVDPGTYKIKDGQLLVFYNFLLSNTLNFWNADEDALYTKAEANWAKIK